MFTRFFTERKRSTLFVLAGTALLLLAGCGGKATSTTPTTNHSSVITTSSESSNTATAVLKGIPTGNATLSWNYTDQMLTVQLTLAGLAPNSIHPAHIHEGSCTAAIPGKVLYGLPNVVANAQGVATLTDKISVPKGIPASGWYINVHNGPTISTPTQAISIACGNVTNHTTSLRSIQSAQVILSAMSVNTQEQAINGIARMTLSSHTMTVQLTVTGLQPNSLHAAHIHAGSCMQQGAVVYGLPVLKANAAGKAQLITIIHNVPSLPANSWYINVHRSNDLSTQTTFDPIACGNVVVNQH